MSLSLSFVFHSLYNILSNLGIKVSWDDSYNIGFYHIYQEFCIFIKILQFFFTLIIISSIIGQPCFANSKYINTYSRLMKFLGYRSSYPLYILPEDHPKSLSSALSLFPTPCQTTRNSGPDL